MSVTDGCRLNKALLNKPSRLIVTVFEHPPTLFWWVFS